MASTVVLPVRVRRTGWDVTNVSLIGGKALIGQRPFMGADGSLLPALPADLMTKVEKAQEWAEAKKLEYQAIRQKHLSDLQSQEMDKRRVEARKLAIQKMCRVYIGSVPFELNESDMTQLFLQFGPVDVATMQRDPVTNKHKGFCFIEYKIPEAAELAIKAMNGYKIGTRVMKVSEPNNTQAQIQPMIDQIKNDVKDYPGIYVANLHPDIDEAVLQTMLEEFGTVSTVELVTDAVTSKHKGYGYVKFETMQSAKDAVELLNNIELGGQFLFVGKGFGLHNEVPEASVPTPSAAALEAVAAATATITGNAAASAANNEPATDQPAEEASSIAMEEDVAISSTQRVELTQKLAMRTLTAERVITLRNMVGVEDADDPELVDEITEEVAKFGPVKGVKIHVEGDEVMILVGFTEQSSAQSALSLNGRLFDGKHIVAEFIPTTMYHLIDFM